VAEYVDRRFVGHAFPNELAGTLYRTTGGNPLFVVTLIEDLESRQMIRPVDGRWELASTVDEVASRRPDSIRRLLDVQLDRLGVVEQRIVEAASVAGATFAVGAVAHALEMPVETVDASCETLANEHPFLRFVGTETWPTARSSPGTASPRALPARRLARTSHVRLWHRRIGERLEAGYGSQTDSVASELAEHFDEGHAFSRAAHYRRSLANARPAGTEATRRSATSSALARS